MKSKKGGDQHQKKYQEQKIRTTRNKEDAWLKHLKKYPNDKFAAEQIKKVRG